MKLKMDVNFNVSLLIFSPHLSLPFGCHRERDRNGEWQSTPDGLKQFLVQVGWKAVIHSNAGRVLTHFLLVKEKPDIDSAFGREQKLFNSDFLLFFFLAVL